MGGDISVESQLGAGSCFTVVLPLRPVEDDSQRSIQTVPARLQGRRAMLIHCQPALRTLYGSMLESLGLSVLTVADIEEALQAMESGPRPELVVLDYNRPDFPVDAIVQRLRNVPGMESLPVLVFSSTGCPFCEGITARNGVVAKPVCRGDLVAQVTRLLEADSTPPGDALRTGSTGRFDFSSIPCPRDLRILIAEDNAVNRRVLSLMLEKLGYACDAVENGREAVEAVCNRTYDLVLMDIQMPVLDGIGATVEIRKRVAAVARPTIIALTANATKQDQMACFEAGMDGFISKPVQAADLLQVLTSVSVQTAQ
jgi:CheY-like chemotaxis protein